MPVPCCAMRVLSADWSEELFPSQTLRRQQISHSLVLFAPLSTKARRQILALTNFFSARYPPFFVVICPLANCPLAHPIPVIKLLGYWRICMLRMAVSDFSG